MKYTHLIAGLALFVFIALPMVQGHLEGGTDIQKGDYLIDIGYDTPELTADRATVFLVSLEANGSEIETNSAWVRIKEKNGPVVFTAKLLPEPTGAYSFTAILPKKGNYDFTVRFETPEETVEETTDLQVKGSANYRETVLWITIAVLLCLLFITLLRKRRGKR
ncbi:hypothetical protein C4573_00540 [Candidatus Woesearchaeota archaeon]|nr:MAG: hypothetical protein C4573_00540 [Candidatus Woesearchaeota archaeon]